MLWLNVFQAWDQASGGVHWWAGYIEAGHRGLVASSSSAWVGVARRNESCSCSYPLRVQPDKNAS